MYLVLLTCNGTCLLKQGTDSVSLTHEQQDYREKIVDIREEILRKRRAGKLPGDTRSVLNAWWQPHSEWPYPTEDDKARLVQETGLQLKQINNWFINQKEEELAHPSFLLFYCPEKQT
ncbi:UNVERIFIED_CONTAM: Homeobox protein knotted-1-like 3 [Sesamum radiatum]|uniref:Homeobox protein knotted-1-like 3 n=1 Tax=Sesamum radiatum TaxID=300843 RepID=A0AAW2TSI1_SESRA